MLVPPKPAAMVLRSLFEKSAAERVDR